MKQRLTQKNLLLGFYWAGRKSLNPGLSIWFKDHYIYPRTRVKVVSKEGTLFKVLEAPIDASAAKPAEMG